MNITTNHQTSLLKKGAQYTILIQRVLGFRVFK